jgi:hypothetical protein
MSDYLVNTPSIALKHHDILNADARSGNMGRTMTDIRLQWQYIPLAYRVINKALRP